MLSISACLEWESDKQSSGVVNESLLNALVTKFHISIICIVINLLWGVVFIYINIYVYAWSYDLYDFLCIAYLR